jgi:hypothetical protein
MIANKGCFPWHKGRVGVYSKETLKLMSEAKKGKPLSDEHKKKIGKNNARYWKGKQHSEETKRKISLIHKGKHHSPLTEFKKGYTSRLGVKTPLETKLKQRLAHLGQKHSEEHIRKQRESIKKNLPRTAFKKGNQHIFWKGGISFEPYSPEFNQQLKEKIRKRDNYVCQDCGFAQNGKKLTVHHIDYNKKNNSPSNLIALCSNCHSKTNYNREDWQNYFKNKIERSDFP